MLLLLRNTCLQRTVVSEPMWLKGRLLWWDSHCAVASQLCECEVSGMRLNSPFKSQFSLLFKPAVSFQSVFVVKTSHASSSGLMCLFGSWVGVGGVVSHGNTS